MSIQYTGTIYDPTVIQPSRINFPRLLAHWIARARQRRRLATLEDDRLDDMGITATQADREAAKWFWQD